MIYPPPQVIFALLILSTAVVLIWDIRYNPFGEDEDGIKKKYKTTRKKLNLFKPIYSLNLFKYLFAFFDQN